MLCFFIRVYQWFVSPLLGPRCRFYPSCSEYAKQAIIAKGPIKGLAITTYRLLRCHPFSKGGYEPFNKES
jgi:putative membrane protein insertion efficiency factor